jgi:hypothetical protein
MEREGVRVLIADYKTLHGSHTPAPSNIQLMAQAILVIKNNPDVEEVYASLIEPFNDPTYTTVMYKKGFLEEKAKWFEEIVAKAYEDDPEQIPGSKQCKWCAGLYACASAKSHILSCLKKYK